MRCRVERLPSTKAGLDCSPAALHVVPKHFIRQVIGQREIFLSFFVILTIMLVLVCIGLQMVPEVENWSFQRLQNLFHYGHPLEWRCCGDAGNCRDAFVKRSRVKKVLPLLHNGGLFKKAVLCVLIPMTLLL